MNFDKELRAVNEIAYLKQEIKKLKLLLQKIAGMQRNYVCRYCGKQATKPHGGKCPYSPHTNKCHEFIKA